MNQRKSDLSTIASVAQLLAVILLVAALYFAREVFIPLALGLLLSFLLSPFVNRLERIGVSNLLAVLATGLIVFVLLAGGLTLIGRELHTLISELPQHKNELVSKARSVSGLTGGVGGDLDELAEEVTEAIDGETDREVEQPTSRSFFEEWTDRMLPAGSVDDEKPPADGTSPESPIYVTTATKQRSIASWATFVGTVLGPLATAGLVTVCALFILIHREDLRDRIISVISHGDYVTTTEALNEAAHRISRYLIAQTVINASYGVILTIGLFTIGATMTDTGMFPNALLWGVLATCLRYVPYIGPTVSAIFPLAIALSVFPGYGVFLATLVLIVGLELVSNNVMEPWLYGTSTGISAVAVVFAALFWGWLWGPVGLLLSTPLTVCLVVLGRYVPRFKLFSTLLGEDLVIRPGMRFYQRLLANDDHHARHILQEQLQELGFDNTCDKVLIPALKRLRIDHADDRLTDTDAGRLFALATEFIVDVSSDIPSESTSQDTLRSTRRPIVGCAAHDDSELLILNLLQRSGRGSFEVKKIDNERLPEEVTQDVMIANPPVVVITVLPPGGFAQARFLCKSIRRQGYVGPVVVACFGKFKYFDKLFVKFRKAGATNMTTSFRQTRSKVESLLALHDRAAATSDVSSEELVEVST